MMMIKCFLDMPVALWGGGGGYGVVVGRGRRDEETCATDEAIVWGAEKGFASTVGIVKLVADEISRFTHA